MGSFEKWHPLEEFEKESILDASQQTLDSVKDLEDICAGWPAEFLQPINHLSVAAAEMLECARADINPHHRMNQLDELISEIMGVTLNPLSARTSAGAPEEPEPPIAEKLPVTEELPAEDEFPVIVEPLVMEEPSATGELADAAVADIVAGFTVEPSGKEDDAPAEQAPDEPIVDPAAAQSGIAVKSAAAEPVSDPLILPAANPAGGAIPSATSKPAAHWILPACCEPGGDTDSHKTGQPLLQKKASYGLSAQVGAKSVKIYRKADKDCDSSPRSSSSRPDSRALPAEPGSKQHTGGIICSSNLRISSK